MTIFLKEAITQRYKFVPLNKNWFTARVYCRERNAELVAIDNKVEQASLEVYLGELAKKGQYLLCVLLSCGKHKLIIRSFIHSFIHSFIFLNQQ